jgi:hypothetical protein
VSGINVVDRRKGQMAEKFGVLWHCAYAANNNVVMVNVVLFITLYLQLDVDFKTVCSMHGYPECDNLMFVKWPSLANQLVKLVDKKHVVAGITLEYQ